MLKLPDARLTKERLGIVRTDGVFSSWPRPCHIPPEELTRAAPVLAQHEVTPAEAFGSGRKQCDTNGRLCKHSGARFVEAGWLTTRSATFRELTTPLGAGHRRSPFVVLALSTRKGRVSGRLEERER
jgi:hypothetical protein